MTRPFSKLIGAAVLGLAAAVAAPTASAAIVTGSWDPALPNPPFVDLGWTTTINLQISDSCSAGAQSLPFIVNFFGRSFGCHSNPAQSSSPFAILSAEIGFYDLTSLLLVDVLRFNASSFTPLLLDLNTGGAITYLLSLTNSNVLRGNIARTNGFDFRLGLPGAAPAIMYRALGTNGFITDTTVPTETAFATNADDQRANVLATTRLEVGQTLFNFVPEPGSLALALLALGVAGANATRRAHRDSQKAVLNA